MQTITYTFRKYGEKRVKRIKVQSPNVWEPEPYDKACEKLVDYLSSQDENPDDWYYDGCE